MADDERAVILRGDDVTRLRQYISPVEGQRGRRARRRGGPRLLRDLDHRDDAEYLVEYGPDGFHVQAAARPVLDAREG